MPRRVKLSDKEERILVQAQLMGVDASSLARIANQIKRDERNKKIESEIANVVAGYSWTEKSNKNKMTLTTPDGFVLEANLSPKHGAYYWSSTYDITVTKPKTRYKKRIIQDVKFYPNEDWLVRMMPNRSKELLCLILWADAKRHLYS